MKLQRRAFGNHEGMNGFFVKRWLVVFHENHILIVLGQIGVTHVALTESGIAGYRFSL